MGTNSLPLVWFISISKEQGKDPEINPNKIYLLVNNSYYVKRFNSFKSRLLLLYRRSRSYLFRPLYLDTIILPWKWLVKRERPFLPPTLRFTDRRLTYYATPFYSPGRRVKTLIPAI